MRELGHAFGRSSTSRPKILVLSLVRMKLSHEHRHRGSRTRDTRMTMHQEVRLHVYHPIGVCK